MDNAPAVVEAKPVMLKEQFSAEDIQQQINLVQTVMKRNMQEGEHYGKIPGCGPKPTLLKAGSEKLLQLFRLRVELFGDEEPKSLGQGHREYAIKCALFHIPSGKKVGEGVGTCSTMESKYRYRWVNQEQKPDKATQEKMKTMSTGRWHKDYRGGWQWQERQENPDVADAYNTVLKMAKKRAVVDATLTATAASDIFTQDIEDIKPQDREPDTPPAPQPAPATSDPAGQGDSGVEPSLDAPPPPSDDDAPYNQPAQDAPAPASGEQTPQKKMWHMLLKICDGDVDQAKEQLMGRTKFKNSNGKDDPSKVSDKQAWFIIKDIEKAYDAAKSK